MSLKDIKQKPRWKLQLVFCFQRSAFTTYFIRSLFILLMTSHKMQKNASPASDQVKESIFFDISENLNERNGGCCIQILTRIFRIANSPSLFFWGWKILLSGSSSSSKLLRQCYQLFLWLLAPALECLIPIVRKFSSKLLNETRCQQIKMAFVPFLLLQLLEKSFKISKSFKLVSLIRTIVHGLILPPSAITHNGSLPSDGVGMPGLNLDRNDRDKTRLILDILPLHFY